MNGGKFFLREFTVVRPEKFEVSVLEKEGRGRGAHAFVLGYAAKTNQTQVFEDCRFGRIGAREDGNVIEFERKSGLRHRERNLTHIGVFDKQNFAGLFHSEFTERDGFLGIIVFIQQERINA